MVMWQVLKPGHHCVGAVWDDAPMVTITMQAMEEVSGAAWNEHGGLIDRYPKSSVSQPQTTTPP